MRTRYDGWCHDCNRHVPAGAGYLHGKDAWGKWIVLCPAYWAQADDDPDPEPEWRPPPMAWSPPVPQCLRVLGLVPPVSTDDVKRRYRALAMEHHPDHGGDAGRFIAIKLAYGEALSLAGGGR